MSKKKRKWLYLLLLCAAAFVLGCIVERTDKDAFTMETVAEDDGAPYDLSYTENTDSSGKININTAPSVELVELDGIGEALAERIITYRTENGPYGTIEDIMKVSGISQKKFDAVKEYICVE